MDTKERSSANKANILKALHRFGWLRTKDIASLVWTKWKRAPQASEFAISALAKATDSQLRMAQRTLKAMNSEGLLLVAKAPDGSVMHTLSAKGAQILLTNSIDASTGKDLIKAPSLGYFRHRCISNEIAIRAIIHGYRVSTEREIAKGSWKWGRGGLYGKTPDVLVKTHGHLHWIEVERSRKNQADYARLIKWLIVLRTCIRTGQSPTDETDWGLTVIFVCSASFARKLTNDLRERGFTEAEINFLIRFEIDLYKFEVINFV